MFHLVRNLTSVSSLTRRLRHQRLASSDKNPYKPWGERERDQVSGSSSSSSSMRSHTIKEDLEERRQDGSLPQLLQVVPTLY
jgi:hypothetical protein